MPNIIATAEAVNQEVRYATQLTVHQHTAIADEPVTKGGKDTGPAPGDYLCMALASCKAITLRMYAERKNWPVGDIKVKVDMVKGEDMPSGVTTFFCEISFSGTMDEDQEKRLRQIAKACPVSKTLGKVNDVVTIIA